MEAFCSSPIIYLLPSKLYSNHNIKNVNPIRRYHQQTKRMTASSPSEKKSILVFGGGSTLGSEVVDRFTSAPNWTVYTLDFYDASVECGGVNGCALPEFEDTTKPISLALPVGSPPKIQVEIARKCLLSACSGKFDIILNATLGFSPASLKDQFLFESFEYMYRTSVESSLVTSKLASEFLISNNHGLLVFIGNVAALSNTKANTLLGFGCAKASVHQMVRLLSHSVGDDLPEGSSVIGIVPEVLDTPLHRSMNDGDACENWTPCDVIATKLLQWADDINIRPPNGSLISVATSKIDKRAAESNGYRLNEVESSHIFRLIEESSFVQPTPF